MVDDNMQSMDLKSVFTDFLTELEEANNKPATNGKVRPGGNLFVNPYKSARMSLINYDDPIIDAKSLKKVPKIGDKIVTILTEKLKTYCQQHNQPFPENFEPPKRKVGNDVDNDAQPPVKKRKRAYIPKRRSGGYAILIALYLKDAARNGLKKSEIIKHAVPYCDASFESNSSNGQFYSAWNSVKSLEKNELISINNKLYFLTDEGLELGRKLKIAEDINSSPNSKVESSFDNSLLVTPDKNYRKPIVSDDILLVDDPRDLLSSPVIRPSKIPMDNDIPTLLPSSTTVISRQGPIHDRAAKTLNGIKYSIWPIDDVDIILIIDSREVRSKQQSDYFVNTLSSLNVKCEVRQLSVGDMCWIAKHRTSGHEIILNSICERKRMDDLLASIYDGRFFEQKARLWKLMTKQCYYLIEQNNSNGERCTFDAKALRSMATAKYQMMAASNNIVKQFDKIEDTIKFLSNITKIMYQTYVDNRTKFIVIKARTIANQKEYGEIMQWFRKEFDDKPSRYESCHTYTSFDETMGKTQMYTVKEMFLKLLMCIKGVSLDKAISIQKLFPTPSSLFEYYTSGDNDGTKSTVLMDLTKHLNKQKKIPNQLSQKIYEVWGRVNK